MTEGLTTKGNCVTDRLWAPWRLSYLQGGGYLQGGVQSHPPPVPAEKLRPGADPKCFLCRAAAGDDDRHNLVLARGASTLVMLNRYPYNNGHLMVAPLDHRARLDQLSPSVNMELMDWLTRLVSVLEQAVKAEGVNIGLNLGHPAGAGVPGHLHWHLVPRWYGDMNFMTPVADMRVISASLDAMWEVITSTLGQPSSAKGSGA